MTVCGHSAVNGRRRSRSQVALFQFRTLLLSTASFQAALPPIERTSDSWLLTKTQGLGLSYAFSLFLCSDFRVTRLECPPALRVKVDPEDLQVFS